MSEEPHAGRSAGKIEGAEAIEVQIAAGTVLVRMEEGERLSRERAAQAVRQAGFALGGFAPAGDGT